MHRSLVPVAAIAAASLSLVTAAPAAGALAGAPQTVQQGLAVPWEVAPAPDGRMFITERDTGRIRVVLPDGTLRGEAAYQGPSSVFGLALHPRFAENRYAYVFERYSDAGATKTRIARLRDDGTNLIFDRAILSGIRSGDFHDGGRMVFGPDGRLYVTTGDQHDPSLPRDRQSLNGKILRLEAPGDARDGTAPADNPFFADGGNAAYVWSLGHRHPQGIAFDAQGRLWETEHGPSGEGHAPAGATCCRDELNLIVRGGDYGWPQVAGDQRLAGTIPPVVHSGNDTTWAPGDLAVGDDGVLYAPALRGEHLHAFEPSGDTIARHYELYRGEFGRLRVAVASGGALLFAQDGASARLLRVPFASEPEPEPESAPAPVTPVAPGAATEPATPAPRAVVPPSTTPAALDRLLRRTRSALRRRGLRRLVRRRSVLAGTGGLPAGRLRVRASLVRPGRRAVRVAGGSVRVRDRRMVTVRLGVTRRGRRALRGVRRGRLVLRAVHVGADGARVARRVRVTVRRR